MNPASEDLHEAVERLIASLEANLDLVASSELPETIAELREIVAEIRAILTHIHQD